MTSLDLRLLVPFVVLADELHFGRAAARLHLTQSALSQQIQRLERQVGVRLVERDTHRVRLAPAGQAFLAGARDAVERADGAVREARRTGGARPALRIGVDIQCPPPISRQIRRLGAERPDIDLRVSVQQQDDVVADLRSGRLDLGVGWTAPPAGDDRLGCATLTTVELYGVVRSDDPLARGDRLPRASLTGHRLVLYRPVAETRPFYDFFRSCFAGAGGGGPDVVHVPVLDDPQPAMLDTVERLGGFTVCAGLDAVAGRDRVAARPFDPPVRAGIVVLWRGHTPPALVDDLRTAVDGAGIEAER